jgi:hypothetical protein
VIWTSKNVVGLQHSKCTSKVFRPLSNVLQEKLSKRITPQTHLFHFNEFLKKSIKSNQA